MPQTKEKLGAKALNSWRARGCVDTIRLSPYTREREGGAGGEEGGGGGGGGEMRRRREGWRES